MRKKFYQKKAQTIVEILLAVTLLGMVITGVVMLFSQSFQGSMTKGFYNRAYLIAEEGLEAVRAIRREDFLDLANGYHGLSKADGFWKFLGESDEVDGFFTRQIAVESVDRVEGEITEQEGVEDLDTKKITVTVSWVDMANNNRQIYLSEYLMNWMTYEWMQTTQSEFDGGSFLYTGSTLDAGADGEVKLLAISASEENGDPFLLESTSRIIKMYGSSRRASYRFTAQSSGEVDAVRVYIHENTGSSPEYTYGIKADSYGEPSGSWLGWGKNDTQSDGWKRAGLNQQTAYIEEGQIYHFMGFCSPCSTWYYLSPRRTSPNNNFIPLLEVPDLNANTLKAENYNNWVTQNSQPVYIIEFSDGRREGNPYYDAELVEIYEGGMFGQKLFVEAPGAYLEDVEYYVAKDGGTPADDLYFRLENLTDGGIVVQDRLVRKTGVSTSFQWKTYEFSEPLFLEGDHYYRVSLFSPGTLENKPYRAYRLITENEDLYKDLTYGGADEFMTYSEDYGQTWTDVPSNDFGGFRINSLDVGGGYYTSGNYVSASLDTGSENTVYKFMEWDITLVAASSIKFQIRTADTEVGLDSATFVGSDGTGSTYYEANRERIVLDSGASGKRFFQFKIYLAGDGNSTPVLESVKIYYVP